MTRPKPTVNTLPIALTDSTNQIDQRCQPQGRDRASSFNITGRGGLPESPDTLQPDITATEWVTSDRPTAATPSPVPIDSSTPSDPIIEANSWTQAPDGTVVLIAAGSTTIPTHSGWHPLNCGDRPPHLHHTQNH